jgi:hypothetical protein
LQGFRASWNSLRPDLENQLSKLERFVSLCRDNGVQLTIATSPMIRENLDLHEPGMIDALAERICEIAPLWDFNSPPLIARKEYWVDVSHLIAPQKDDEAECSRLATFMFLPVLARQGRLSAKPI